MSTDTPGPLEAADTRPVLYPPLQVWKVALLMLVTFCVYSTVWFFRSARDVRAGAGKDYQPWLWVIAPFVGLAEMIASIRLSDALEEWCAASNARKVVANKAALIGVSLLLAHILLGLTGLVGAWLWFFAFAGLTVPLLVMQAQLNNIKVALPDPSFRSEPMRYTSLQIAALIIFGSLFSLFVIILAVDAIDRGAKTPLAAGDVIEDVDLGFRLEVTVDDWSRIEVGYNSTESAVELVTGFGTDYAMVFVADEPDMDSRADFRIGWIRESYPRASCNEHRELSEDGESVIGTLDCTGRNALDGYYQFRSRVVQDEERAVELLMFIAAEEKFVLERRSSALTLADGLSLR